MTDVPARPSIHENRNPGSLQTPSNQPIVGIWQLGPSIHQGQWSNLSLAQPADASGSPRFDYVIRQTGDESVESKRQITNFSAAASSVLHPNLIAVLDASCHAQHPYLVMPRIEGATMAEHLTATPPKQLPVALWFVRQVAQALVALHEAGWVHGDVKPENVLIGSRGHATLLDLGFACRIHTVNGGQYRGTPRYSSPESLSGKHAAVPAMDVFSLGKILWQWMTCVEPVSSTALEPVASLVEQLVHPDPASRPSASVVVKDLLRLEIETLGHHIGPHSRPAARRRAA